MNIDRLNIILILISAILAIVFPLELFILAYVILGPLHYLTEINWLEGKKFFVEKRRISWLVIGSIAAAIVVIPKLVMEYSNPESALYQLSSVISSYSNGAIFATLSLAIAGHFIKNQFYWVLSAIPILLVAYYLNSTEQYNIIVGLFIPTIVHVYVFTLLFMLYGAKKTKSKLGYVSVVIACLVPLLFININLDQLTFVFPDSFKDVYIENRFHVVPVLFSKYLGISDGTTFFFYESMELRLLMFMAFIYTYHYLNWFSKTTVIKWHKNLTTKRTITIITLWLAMLLLFYLDFRLGFLISLFFSFLHVILEFPLNILSIRGLFGSGD